MDANYRMSQSSNSSIDLLVILGPTATGKTQLAIKLADELDGEIISADSRQVYRGMDIGTGKDLDEYEHSGKSIPYHLIDIADPMEEYNVAQFQKDVYRVLSDIKARNKLPILCGGTGFYIKAILMDSLKFPKAFLKGILKDCPGILAHLYSFWLHFGAPFGGPFGAKTQGHKVF